MSSYLTKHALTNVCCSIEQDHQFLFRPIRLTPTRGVRRFVEVEWENTKLPFDGLGHVFQIGQLDPRIVRLDIKAGQWINISNNDDTLINVYDENGVMVNKNDVYLSKTRTRNFIVAIKENKNVTDIGTGNIFIRFYTNAYFASSRSNLEDQKVISDHSVVFSRADVIIFQNKVLDVTNNNNGVVYLIQNGKLVDNFHPDAYNAGDVLEYVLDTSIKEIIDLPVNQLETFISKLDSTAKYLLYIDKKEKAVIDFKDDVDVWIMYKDPVHGAKGVFYHKYEPSAMRMVTNKDYSIPVSNVLSTVQQNEGMSVDDNLFIRLHIRKGGVERPLIFENSRIWDLMKLSDTSIKNAMVGTVSTLTEWQAASLEQSMYTKIMREQSRAITNELVIDAYGYNQASKVIGDTPSLPYNENGVMVVQLPHRLSYDASIFEYNKNGDLIWGYPNLDGSIYSVKSEATGYVEGIAGTLGESSGVVYGKECVDLDVNRTTVGCYYCEKVNGIPNFIWKTGVLDEHYRILQDSVIWLLDEEEYLFAVKPKPAVLFKTFNLPSSKSVLSFDITSKELWCDSGGEEIKEGNLIIPPGKLEVFLNKKSLIRNLDYYVQWPRVIITNKEYLDDDDLLQEISYRCTGLCNNAMQLDEARDFGFIEHGLLSNNNRFDVRDDVVNRIVVGGQLRTMDELGFSEELSTHDSTILENGKPYLIDDIVVPLDGFSKENTYTLRAKARALDTKVSNYMTLYYPEPVKPAISYIEKRYDLHSVFLNKIISDLRTGELVLDGDGGRYTDEYLRTIVRSYEWLLDFDPVINGYDEKYVKVHPHRSYQLVYVNSNQYNFLARVVELYLWGKVDLSRHLAIN